ncbi:MAG: hypothetical protein ACRDNG_08765 [Gaiellaceae bacterium]
MSLHPAAGDQRSRKEQYLLAALADVCLHPEEELDLGIAAALETGRLVEVAHLSLHGASDLLRGELERIHVERLELALADPARERIGVVADDRQAESVGLEQRRAAAHKGIKDDAFEIVTGEVALGQGAVVEFG